MNEIVRLPAPQHTTVSSFETVLHTRRSVRDFARKSLSLANVAHLLWAGCGIASIDGKRTIPSAGGLYPISLYVATGRVQGAPAGAYRYEPNGHRLVQSTTGDFRLALAQAAMGQEWLADAAAIIVITAEFARTTGKYGDRGAPYVLFEAGASAQNISLEATALRIGIAIVGAFNDDAVATILNLSDEQQALALLPVGSPSQI